MSLSFFLEYKNIIYVIIIEIWLQNSHNLLPHSCIYNSQVSLHTAFPIRRWSLCFALANVLYQKWQYSSSDHRQRNNFSSIIWFTQAILNDASALRFVFAYTQPWDKDKWWSWQMFMLTLSIMISCYETFT